MLKDSRKYYGRVDKGPVVNMPKQMTKWVIILHRVVHKVRSVFDGNDKSRGYHGIGDGMSIRKGVSGGGSQNRQLHQGSNWHVHNNKGRNIRGS